MGRALLAVAAALVACFAVLGTLIYVTRDEDGVAVDAILSEQLTRAVNGASRDGSQLALADLTPFGWDEVVVFDARTPRDDVSRELGFEWQGQLEFTAQTTDLFVFLRAGELVRFADYRGVGDFEGLREPFTTLTPAQAVFDVRGSIARPAAPQP